MVRIGRFPLQIRFSSHTDKPPLLGEDSQLSGALENVWASDEFLKQSDVEVHADDAEKGILNLDGRGYGDDQFIPIPNPIGIWIRNHGLKSLLEAA